jgi:Protein of unknown function (DUF3592)
MNSLFFLLFAGIWIWTGIWLILVASREIRIAIQSKNWIAILAIVEGHKMISSGQYGVVDYYHCWILCTYDVQGRRYQNSNQLNRETWNSHSPYIRGNIQANVEASAWRDYPIGQTVQLFYNPKSPAESTASIDHDYVSALGWFSCLGLGICFLLMGMMLVAPAILQILGRRDNISPTLMPFFVMSILAVFGISFLTICVPLFYSILCYIIRFLRRSR